MGDRERSIDYEICPLTTDTHPYVILSGGSAQSKDLAETRTRTREMSQ